MAVQPLQGGGGDLGWVYFRRGIFSAGKISAGENFGTPNSIAFGSAPRREADSQPISQLARPAARQKETHRLGFVSVADSAPSSGEYICP